MSKKEKINLPILAQDVALVRYIEEIKKIPMLTESEEFDLALRWHENQDIDAAQQLVRSHLRYVAKIAMQYRGYGLPMTDIISEGNIGLMTAVKKFDPHKGFRLSTYSSWWIKATIQDYILKSWSLVKIGTSSMQKKLFFNLKKIKNRLMHLHNGQIPADASRIIAQELQVPEKEVKYLENRDLDVSLNQKMSGEDGRELIDTIASNTPAHEDLVIAANEMRYKKNKFQNAFAKLTEKEQEIIYARKLLEKPETLATLSKKYNVSSERIRQIEENALKKLKQMVLEGEV